MAAATKRPPGHPGPGGVKLQRNDTVRVNGRKGTITGFTCDGGHVYMRFVEEGEGPTPGKFSPSRSSSRHVGRPRRGRVIEMGIEHEEDGEALASLVLTLRLASSNLVRAANRLSNRETYGAGHLFVAGCMDELSAAIEHRFLRGRGTVTVKVVGYGACRARTSRRPTVHRSRPGREPSVDGTRRGWKIVNFEEEVVLAASACA